MALTPGTRLGPYEILSRIGAGGMGEVYKATDTRLNRTVAIKVLPSHFAFDPEMKQRFEREAQTIAGLNHPHICTLHDVGSEVPTDAPGTDPVSFLVMEFVEGETLADRLARGPLSIDEALRIGGQVADALVRAHGQGVVHRDLKPANIMLARSGPIRPGSSQTSRPGSSPAVRPSSPQAARSGSSPEARAGSSGAPPPGSSPDTQDASGETRLGSSPGSGSGSSAAAASGSSSGTQTTTRATLSGSVSVKLLDFGLAKWAAPDEANPIAAQSTRLDVTAQGTMLGTLQYMSPEQVEGRDADARTDIFAFGAVLYEMLTGRKAFEGKSQASLIGAIMKGEPRPVAHTQPLTPALLEHLIARCLAKDPDDRWQDARDVLIAIQWIAQNRTVAAGPAGPTWRRRDLVMAAGVFTLLAVVSVPASLQLRGWEPPEAVQFRHTITGLSETDFALSPDGHTIAFVAKPDLQGVSLLYVRPADGLVAVALAGTRDAAQPFWSPDSAYIGYVAAGRLKKVPAAGGASQDVCEAPDFSGGAWSPEQGGTIVFGTAKGLYRVSAEGGTPAPMGELGEGETGQLWPGFLADGRHFTYLAWSNDVAKRAVYTGVLGSSERQKLLDAEFNVVQAPAGSGHAAPGYLLYQRGATLYARSFDGETFTGDAKLVAGPLAPATEGRGNFSVSRTGALIYFQGQGAGQGAVGHSPVRPNTAFGWFDGAGRRLQGGIEAGAYGDMDVSPDGKLVAITRRDAGEPAADIWVIDWENEIPKKITSDPADAVDPVWSPKGDRIAFTSWRNGNADIYVTNANGVGADTPLLESAVDESVEDWSSDGKYIAYLSGPDQDIWALPLGNDGTPGKPFPVVEGKFRKNEPQFSTNGKWLAYTSDEDEAGKFQVYLISFPPVDSSVDKKRRVSTDGGGQPRWQWDDKALIYRTLDDTLMRVGLTLGTDIVAAPPAQHFRVPPWGASANEPTRHLWALTKDGRALLRVAPLASATGAAGVPAVRSLPAVFNPTPANQAGATNSGGRSLVTNGLTAILHWTSLLRGGT